jgi:DNA polymerase theta
LVADILLLKKVIDQPAKKAILVLPYVALVQEKLKWLRRMVEGVTKHIDTQGHPILNGTFPQCKPTQTCIRLAVFLGGSRAIATWTGVDIAVCTIEKANSHLLMPPSRMANSINLALSSWMNCIRLMMKTAAT